MHINFFTSSFEIYKYVIYFSLLETFQLNLSTLRLNLKKLVIFYLPAQPSSLIHLFLFLFFLP